MWWDELTRPGERPGSSAWQFASVLAAERCQWRCAGCGYPEDLEVHHKVPLCFGGTSEPDNLVLLCRICHDKEHRSKRSEKMRFDPYQKHLIRDD